MQNQKTDAEWNKIRFQNSLGPQIGGIGHDVAVYLAAGIEPTKKNIENVKKWLDTLYDISESKKAELTEVKQIDMDKAVEQGDKWKKGIGYNKESKQEEINDELQIAKDQEREAQDKINFQN